MKVESVTTASVASGTSGSCVAGEGALAPVRLQSVPPAVLGLILGFGLVLMLHEVGAAPGRPPADRAAEARLAFHLGRAEALYQALAPAVHGPCPRLPDRAAWDAHLAVLVDEGVTFAAHLDEAWREAKRADDAGLRARVKATKRRLLAGDAVGLVTKLTRCAWRHGSVLDVVAVWRRAAAEVPERRRQVARDAERIAPGL
jgi:hypothetical protein